MSDSRPKVADAISEAQSIVEAAESRAREITAKADKVYKVAKEAGYQAGYEEGYVEAVRQAVRWFELDPGDREKLVAEVARLALSVAQSVVGEHVKLNPELVKNLATTALRQSIVGQSANIVVNPEDVKILEEAKEQLRQIAGSGDILIQADPTIARGGCIVRSAFGEVDARIETLIDVVSSRLGVSHEKAARSE
ncbi:MAG: hypothetical protein IT291_07525 [Deltaproteobacteria bacterium]|nr:hypothetical protein [Deltaproteobacteria bacterium]